VLENLQHVRPAELIGFVRSIDWPAIDDATKQVVLHELANAITQFREKNGLDPFDHNLPGEPDTPFRTTRAIVLTASPHCEGVHRDAARSEQQ
jgi:hypothetical protein